MREEIKFNFEFSKLAKTEIKKRSKKINPLIKEISSNNIDKESSINCLNQAFELSNLNQVKELVSEKKSLHPSMIIIIGIGGSNLGTIAVQNAIIDKYSYHKQGKPRVEYVDTVDADNTFDIIKEMEIELAKGSNVIIIAISKSGSTLETLANLEVFIESAKKFRSDIKKFFVIISDKNSHLFRWAEKNNLSRLIVPKQVGGRYSVFSSVSLFPLGMMGVNIDEFLLGARDMHSICLKEKENPSVISASIYDYLFKKKINIYNNFVFSKKLKYFGEWCSQLLAESLGKKFDLSKKRVNLGMTPIVSTPVQLHSLQQLFIEGPNDKLTCFISTTETKNKVGMPFISRTGMTKKISGKDFNYITHSILKGVKYSFQKEKRPFYEIDLPKISEYYLGQLMMYKMFETVFISYLQNINSFDQPGVESYKDATNKELSKI